MTVSQFRSLSKSVSSAVRSETGCQPHDESAPPSYFCTAWRIGGRKSRELFLECMTDRNASPRIRVGLYFKDSAALTSRGQSQAAALESLRAQRPTLQRLGVVPTFSHTGPDHKHFEWSDSDLRKWMQGKSNHRDLVVSWNHSRLDRDVKRISGVLKALVPVWRAWNALAATPAPTAGEEGGLRQVVLELRRRNTALARAARAHHGQICQVCQVNLELVYGPLGRDAVEVHHKVPVGSGVRVNTVDDLACVCPNCHRIIHRQQPMLSIPAVRKLIARNRKRSTSLRVGRPRSDEED